MFHLKWNVDYFNIHKSRSEISAVFMHKYYSIVTDRISPQTNIGCLSYIMFNLKYFQCQNMDFELPFLCM